MFVAAACAIAALLSFQAPPRTASFAEVLKGRVGSHCQMGGGDGVQLLVFPAPGRELPKPEGMPKDFEWPKLTMVGDDFVRLTDHQGREYWIHMSRLSIQTQIKE